ncbi:MAG: hypothetical protein OHK0039_36920 [Bacteroidia bacterium]
MNPEADQILIERYLAGAMPPDERRAFEGRCRQDAVLAQALRQHVLAETAVYQAARRAQYEVLRPLWQAGSVRPLWVLAVAAVVLLLVWFVWNQPSQPGLDQLYAQHMDRPALSDFRGEDTEAASDWYRAIEAYDQQDYAQARQALQAVVADTTFYDRPRAWLFLGLSYLLDADSLPTAVWQASASDAFGQVSPTSAAYEAALWYTALTCLRAGDVPGARTALAAVVAFPGHYRRPAAEDILARLP